MFERVIFNVSDEVISRSPDPIQFYGAGVPKL